MNDSPRFKRAIRSFVRREGKITSGQEAAIEKLWPLYGLEYSESQVDLAQLFGRTAFNVLEIGFGNGLSLAEMAADYPDQNFLGIEVHRPGVGSLLVQVGQRELTNVRVSQEDAVNVLRHQIKDACIDRVQIFFPDPWHKKRHHKRRLIQPLFVEELARVVKPGGMLHIATDWENYAEHILEVMSASSMFGNTGSPFVEKPSYRPTTKYEMRGTRLGHGVWDMVFKRAAWTSEST
jgi:tRNA (guanine-N7-)-methyltransferase